MIGLPLPLTIVAGAAKCSSWCGHVLSVEGRSLAKSACNRRERAATAPGEALHGLTVDGLRLTRVLALVRQRDVTVPVYHCDGKLLRHVPGDWYVYDADPWAPGQVVLFVGPTWPQPAANSPVPGNPVPSPTRTQ